LNHKFSPSLISILNDFFKIRAAGIPMSEPRKKRVMFLSNISIAVMLLIANAKNKQIKRILYEYALLTNRNIIKNKYIPVHLAHKKN